jgi:hypothetical protein
MEALPMVLIGTSSIDGGFTYSFNRKIISRWRFLAGKINYNCWFSWEITYKYGNLNERIID